MKLKHYLTVGPSARFRALAATALVVSSMFGPAALQPGGGMPALAAAASVEAVPADFIRTLASETLVAVGTDDYPHRRDQVAAAVATALGIDAGQMQSAWAAADDEHQRALLTGLTQLGVPYRRNSSVAGVGFDCSGLTTYAWAGAGVALVRQSTAQIRAAAVRTPDTAQAGDLMQYPGHIMIWLGVDRAVLQSPNPGRSVEIVLYRAGRKVRIGDPTG